MTTQTADQVTAKIRAEMAAQDNLPVPGVLVQGQPVTKAELSAAFDLVADRANWKNPIDATVQLTPQQIILIAQAVPFFAGCEARFSPLSKTVIFDNGGQPVLTYRVTAKGYYAAVGA